MFRCDVRVEIDWNAVTDKFAIRTDAKSKAVEEVLMAFFSCELGAGSDASEPNRIEEYQIALELDMSDDTFRIALDTTGNKGLRTGIIMQAIARLPEIEVQPLAWANCSLDSEGKEGQMPLVRQRLFLWGDLPGR